MAKTNLTNLTLGKNQRAALAFIGGVNGWHTFNNKSRAVRHAVAGLAKRGLVEVAGNQYRLRKMEIRLSDNAAAQYVRRCYRSAPASCGMLHRPEWKEMLEKVQGQWLEVETKHLFEDQFNTVPIPGVSDLGLRIMGPDVEEVRGEIRPGIIKDGWTGKHYFTKADIPAECFTEERKKYLKIFREYPQGRGVHVKLEKLKI